MQLLEQIEGEHDRFLELLASIPDSRRREAGVWGDGWTIQDLVAHLMEWQLMFLGWYREGRDGGTPNLPAPGYRWNQTPELNRAIWRKHRRRASARIMQEFERSYREIRGLVVDLSSAALLAPGHFGWTGKHPLTTYLAPNTSGHYRFATKILRRWLRQQTVGAAPAAASNTTKTGKASPGTRSHAAAAAPGAPRPRVNRRRSATSTR
jgi:hypothetical protein